jgi:RNA polymerase sigma factor (sigma-70 family)
MSANHAILSKVLIRKLARPLADGSERTDGELLSRFGDFKEESAFTELLNRHARMTFAISRRLLVNTSDVDDVCQAAFLLLARKAPSLWRERSVAGWLVGVIRKLAADVRKVQRRRQQREQKAAQRVQHATVPDTAVIAASKEVAQLLDEELATLPYKYREPILLCCLEGLPKAVVAARLGWPEGTVSGRVARGKALLRIRLERRGVVPAVALALLAGAAQTHASPTILSMAIYQTALSQPIALKAVVPVRIFHLFYGALHAMFITKLKFTVAALTLAVALCLFGSGLINSGMADDPASVQAPPAIASVPQEAEQEKLQGKWYCVGVVFGGKAPDDMRMNLEEVKKNTWFAFENNQVRIGGSPSEKKSIAFKVNASASPKQIEMDAGEMKLKACYAVDGGVLLFRMEKDARENFPPSLAVGADSDGALLVLQKERLEATAVNKLVKWPSQEAVALNHMKQLAIAHHNHANDHKGFAGNICDAQGKPLLSWRVKLLPYLAEASLFQQFKLDEPWDSEHNKALLKNMPLCFSVTGNVPNDYTTPFRAFVGKGAAFENGKNIGLPDITDGMSNTLLFVEAADAVPWTKPDDLEFNPQALAPKLGGRFEGVFLGCFCDGSARSFPVALKPATLQKLITRAGGENITPEELEYKPNKPAGR